MNDVMHTNDDTISLNKLRATVAGVSVAALSLLSWILLAPHVGASDARSTQSWLPAVNACCNALTAACLISGWTAIANQRQDLHRRFMLAAFACSTVFLIGYLVHHAQNGDTVFPRTSPYRSAYLMVLLTHILASILALPMILFTFGLALTQRFERHRKWAKFTMPLWLYVSVTGVLIFLMLRSAYHS